MSNQEKKSTPIQAKQSRFVSFFGDITKINMSLSIVVAFLGLICAILVISLIRYALTPKPIYYIPGALNAGFSNPNEIPKGSIIGFSSSWILGLLNFTPETVDQAHENSKKFMDPRFLSKTRYTLDKENDSVKKSSLSSIFSITYEPTVTENDIGLIVKIKGQHAIYMAQSNIKLSDSQYTIYLRKVAPTEVNPYGLLVTNVEQDEKTRELK